jgi:hemerythrin
MLIVEWKECYNTGNKMIDYEHQTILSQINSLYILIDLNFDSHKDEILNVIATIIKYTKQHFANEEKLMGKANVNRNELKKHVLNHRMFVDKMFEWEQLVAHSFTYDMLCFIFNELVRWWDEHILKEDQSYVPYMLGYEKDLLL